MMKYKVGDKVEVIFPIGLGSYELRQGIVEIADEKAYQRGDYAYYVRAEGYEEGYWYFEEGLTSLSRKQRFAQD